MERQSKSVRRVVDLGSGMAVGAALGLLFGLMLMPNTFWGGLAGVAVGLVIGAIVDMRRGAMSRRSILLVLTGLAVIVLIGVAVQRLQGSPTPAISPAAPKEVEVTEEGGACGSAVGLNTGDTLLVGLQGNPSTGYTWELGFSVPSVIQPAGEADVRPASNLLGANATYTFRLRAVGEGEVTLIFIYHRPFEQNVPPVKTCEVTVTVT